MIGVVQTYTMHNIIFEFKIMQLLKQVICQYFSNLRLMLIMDLYTKL